MSKKNEFAPSENAPVMSLSEAMKTMAQVMRGEIEVPEDFPTSRSYFNDEAAKTWHGESPKVANTPKARGTHVTPLRATGRERAPGSDPIGSAIANARQLAAFAKLFVDNGELLSVLASEGADSSASLARRLSKDPANVLRTLKKFEVYGVVQFVNEGLRVKRPVLATEEMDFKLNFKSGLIRLTA